MHRKTASWSPPARVVAFSHTVTHTYRTHLVSFVCLSPLLCHRDSGMQPLAPTLSARVQFQHTLPQPHKLTTSLPPPPSPLTESTASINRRGECAWVSAGEPRVRKGRRGHSGTAMCGEYLSNHPASWISEQAEC